MAADRVTAEHLTAGPLPAEHPTAEHPTVEHPAEQARALDVARRCADAMWAADLASRRLGMRIDDVAPGRARLSMRVTEEMVNGHGTCHGGYLAVLADSAFAFAANTYDDVTVAAGFDVSFVRPAHLGDELVAEATERVRHGRSGLYDVTVRRTDGTVVAEYRGRSRSLGRPMLAGSRAAAPGTAPTEAPGAPPPGAPAATRPRASSGGPSMVSAGADLVDRGEAHGA